MGLPTSSISSRSLIVADTSAVINLNATEYAEQIITALPTRFIVVDIVPSELDQGRQRGRPNADMLDSLVKSGVVDIVTMDSECSALFETLVVGPAISTLDDGEAATIAYAALNGGIAVIDERKAMRICAQMFPELCICSTVDMLVLPEVRQALGETALRQAVFLALANGRMRVLPEHLDWVVKLIGIEKAATCTSLPASIRRVSELTG